MIDKIKQGYVYRYTGSQLDGSIIIINNIYSFFNDFSLENKTKTVSEEEIKVNVSTENDIDYYGTLPFGNEHTFYIKEIKQDIEKITKEELKELLNSEDFQNVVKNSLNFNSNSN